MARGSQGRGREAAHASVARVRSLGGPDSYIRAYHQAYGVPQALIRAIGMTDQPSVLTRRQTDVLTLAAHGYTRDETASRLGIGTETVKHHLRGVSQRLNARSQTHAVAIAIRRQLIQPPPRTT